ncbi:MAG: hypothetical protein E7315_02500 [Clostridiales bacterium]|nr:hypothetical protein [Clostridiales bacterium]
MNQLELLLALQAIDEEITACEEEKKRLPVRRTISDLASEIKTLQEKYLQLEEWVTKTEAKATAYADELKQLTAKMDTLRVSYEALSDDEPIEKLTEIYNQIEAVHKAIEKRKGSLATALSQAEKTSKLAGELAKLISKKRSEYDELRPQYDALAAEIDVKIKAIRERYNAVAVQIEKPLMNKYEASRAKHKRPLVEMSGGACRGCNMSLSSVEQHKVAASVVYACENCGHLLYVPENVSG